MRKTILLTPPLSEKERFGDLAEAGAIMPGLGILSLAACLRQQKIPFSILDAEGCGFGLETTVEHVLKLDPKILGITSTTLSIFSAAAVAQAVKNRCPDVIVVLGGPHVTALPYETLDNFAEVDAIILGDGEKSFLQLVNNILAGRAMEQDVDGLIWRDHEEIKTNPKTHHIDDLDSIPFPAWDLLEGFPHRYRPPFHSYQRLPVANIVTARGCPGSCSFCDRSVFGRKCHSHSVEYVVDMIEYLIKNFGIREISIKDDMFTLSKQRVEEFCQLLEKRNIDITWSCNARVNFVNEEILAAMKRAGCWLISYGIESGSPQILKKMIKGINKEQVVKALKLTRKYGITSKGFLIVGIPGETKETIDDTLKFIKKLPLDEISINFFTPFPGSKLYQEVLEEGFQPNFKEMSMQKVTYIPQTISEQDLKQSLNKIIFAFYLRPEKIAFYLCKGFKNYDEFKRVVRMGKVFVHLMISSLKNYFSRSSITP